MFKLFEKKASASEVKPDIPVHQEAGKVLEMGKETVTRDTKTGEFVYQRPIGPAQRKECFAALQENGQLANQFVSVNRQLMAIKKQVIEINDKIVASEKRIDAVINAVRDDMKLDRQWVFNINLGCMEKRVPPNG